MKTAVIPIFGSSSLLCVYAEGFISPYFKRNFACVSVFKFATSILGLSEENSVLHFRTMQIGA